MPKRIGRPHQIAQYANAELKKSLRRSKHNPDRTKSSAKFPSSLEVIKIKTNSLSRATIWTTRTRYSGLEELAKTQKIRCGGTHQEPGCQVWMKSLRSRTPGMDEVPNQEPTFRRSSRRTHQEKESKRRYAHQRFALS